MRGHGSVYMLVGVIAPVCVLQRSKGPVVAVLIEVPVALIARKLKRDHQSRAFAKHMQKHMRVCSRKHNAPREQS